MRVALVLLFIGCVAPGRTVAECNDTTSCRRQSAERERALLAAVAAEPIADRLLVEQVPGALFDVSAQQVFVATGAQPADGRRTLGRARDDRWPLSGGALDRHLDDRETSRAPAVLEPHRLPRRPATCEFELPASAESNAVGATPFDRAGVPHLLWQSALSWNGGTRPPPGFDAASARARGCGFLRVDRELPLRRCRAR